MPKKKEKEAQEKELPLRTAKNLGMGHLGLRGNDWERRRKHCGEASGGSEGWYTGNTAS